MWFKIIVMLFLLIDSIRLMSLHSQMDQLLDCQNQGGFYSTDTHLCQKGLYP